MLMVEVSYVLIAKWCFYDVTAVEIMPMSSSSSSTSSLHKVWGEE